MVTSKWLFGIPSDTNSSLIAYYEPEFISAFDYYPFGMTSRMWVNYNYPVYRHGFNGKEMDHEAKGYFNSLDYGMRVYDSRTGRFYSVDPLTSKFPYWSSYHFSGNNPIRFIDLDGAEIAPPFVREFAFDAALTFETKPNSTKAKVYGAAMGVGGAIQGASEGLINLFRRPKESLKGLWRMASQTPTENVLDYAMTMAEKYGDLPEPVQEYAVKANALTDLTLLLAPVKKAFTSPKVPISEAPIIVTEQTVNTSKTAGFFEALAAKYLRARPKHYQRNINEVWERAKDADGNVYDPNTGELLNWDKFKSRHDQWHMGHKPGKEYRTLIEKLKKGEITEEQFKKEYHDPNNYQPESPKENMSHRHEQKKGG